MVRRVISKNEPQFTKDLTYLDDYQITIINEYKKIIESTPNIEIRNKRNHIISYGYAHEIKHPYGCPKGWRVWSYDVPETLQDYNLIKNGEHPKRGKLRLVYEFIITTAGDLIINYTNVNDHYYKNYDYLRKQVIKVHHHSDLEDESNVLI